VRFPVQYSRSRRSVSRSTGCVLFFVNDVEPDARIVFGPGNSRDSLVITDQFQRPN
jgi:hypothetical protein